MITTHRGSRSYGGADKAEIVGSNPTRPRWLAARQADRTAKRGNSFWCRSTAGRCPVKAAIGVRIPAPERSCGVTDITPGYGPGEWGFDLTVNQEAPGRNRVITPKGVRRLSAWPRRSVEPDSSERRWFDSSLAHSASGNGLFPLRFRSAGAWFDSRRKHSCRVSHWSGRQSAKLSQPVRLRNAAHF